MENLNSDNVKATFVRDILFRDIRDIFNAQALIANRRIYSVGSERKAVQGNGNTVHGRTGRLRDALENPSFTIDASGNGFTTRSNLPEYIRFLDMKKHGNYQIYNRQIYGILYNNTLKELRYGYTSEIRQKVAATLNDSFNISINK
jgi:ribosomal protein L35AE/L33A